MLIVSYKTLFSWFLSNSSVFSGGSPDSGISTVLRGISLSFLDFCLFSSFIAILWTDKSKFSGFTSTRGSTRQFGGFVSSLVKRDLIASSKCEYFFLTGRVTGTLTVFLLLTGMHLQKCI